MGNSVVRVARTAAVTSAVAAGVTGASWGGYQFLTYQARIARTVIPHRTDQAPNRDGVYLPGDIEVQRASPKSAADIRLMVFGDSTAAGLGVDDGAATPGARLARDLADESGKSVRLSTKAIVGATSRGLGGQIDAMLIAGPPPDVAVIIIGANDVTALNGIEQSARRLGNAVRRLRESGAAVVVGTCPDIGMVRAIPQPLRAVVRSYGLRLAARQRAHVRAAGGQAVPLAQALTPEFLADPQTMFSPDNFHPSAAGYRLAAELLLPQVLVAVGARRGPLPEPPPAPSA
jgi:lysophospholipase L1-like esterase